MDAWISVGGWSLREKNLQNEASQVEDRNLLAAANVEDLPRGVRPGGQGQGGALEGIFGLGDAGYDAVQNKNVARQFKPLKFPAINPYTAECAYFADCILRHQAPALNDAANALRILKLTEQAYASNRRCR